MTRNSWFLLLAGLAVGLIISGRLRFARRTRRAGTATEFAPAPREDAG